MFKKYKEMIAVFLKGIAMGAADVVPGVSGGTIALIVGIYDDLLNTIISVNKEFFVDLIHFRFKDAFARVNLKFILPLLFGILTAVFSLAKLVSFLLTTYPQYIYAFFFGLVFASILIVVKMIREKSKFNLLIFLLGSVLAWLLVGITPIETAQTHLWFVFAGAIAICAMILPGISGSFILLILGKYSQVLGAVVSLNFVIILEFALGALGGIMLFSRLLRYLLDHYYSLTMSLLVGLMLGSLRRVFPWQADNLPVMPSQLDLNTLLCLLFIFFGLTLVLLLQSMTKKRAVKTKV